MNVILIVILIKARIRKSERAPLTWPQNRCVLLVDRGRSSRESLMKRQISDVSFNPSVLKFEEIYASLKYLDRNELASIAREALRLVSLEQEEIVSLVPGDVWKMIFLLSANGDSSDNDTLEKQFRKLGLVSHFWYQLAHESVIAHFKNDDIEHSDWILGHFTHLTELSLHLRGVSNEALNKLTNLTKLLLLDARTENENDEDPPTITNAGLKTLTNLESLIIYNPAITDEGIKHLTNLTSLMIYTFTITDEGIKDMISLTDLDFINDKISDESIKNLTNLRSLAFINEDISNESIKNLVNLTELNLGDALNEKIDADGIKNLTNLTFLHVSQYISPEGIRNLHNLVKLNVNQNFLYEDIEHLTKLVDLDLSLAAENMPDESLQKCTNITTLSLNENAVISDNCLKGLTNLHTLSLLANSKISDLGIKGLSNLTELHLQNNYKISDEGIKNLHQLSKLSLCDNFYVTDEGIVRLTKLSTLYLYSGANITNDALMHLTNLTELHVSNNLISDAGITNLRKLTYLSYSESNSNITSSATKFLTNLRECYVT